ncbi:MAG: 2-hydroxychromene-2-carboxylate isomerase [Cytophagales bacterium]|nr:2-hydroxychromene-2-carboxylate isomerase [Cytophagales bacterium]
MPQKMPQKTIDYYFVPQSPWTYLGHARLVQLAQKHRAIINVLPMDLGKIFPVSGGLPLAKRAPQRQANRLVELARFRDYLGVPLQVQPRYFPVAGDPAALVIIAVQAKDGWMAALDMASKILSGVWAEERNIADVPTLKAMLAECGLPESRYEESLQPQTQALYDRNTQAALDASVFGAPTYIVEGELFWGQDRLDFVERKLAS